MPVNEHEEKAPLSPPQLTESDITAVSDWGASHTDEGFITTLPSGNVVKVRRTMDLLELVQEGRIPNNLIKIVQDAIEAAEGKQQMDMDQYKKQLEENPQMLVDMLEFLEFVCCRVLLKPTCLMPPKRKPEESEEEYEIRMRTWKPPEGSISSKWLSLEDKDFLFNLAQGGTANVEQFRERQAKIVATLQTGGDLSQITQRDSGDQG